MQKKGIDFEIGFDGNIFLTEEQWRTYLRRRPVRYIEKQLESKCTVCGLAATKTNPFQNAHKIGFYIGIVQLGLTPEYIDKDENIVTAHRKICNKKVELTLEESLYAIKRKGAKILPEYLSEEVKQLWKRVSNPG